MKKSRITEIKKELERCIEFGTFELQENTIVDLLTLLNNIHKPNTKVQSPPLIGTHPFKSEVKEKSKKKPARDLNDALNYRVIENSMVRLPNQFIESLLTKPENGMGYQIVDVKLKNGDVLKNKTVKNSSYLICNHSINPNDIESIEVIQ